MGTEAGWLSRLVSLPVFSGPEEAAVNKRKGRKHPFRKLAVLLGAAVGVLLVRFPSKAVSLENQQAQLAAAASAYYEAQARSNRLNAELSGINTADFIERTARREYGYCWYGETIYEVENLDALLGAAGFDVYDGGDEAAEDGEIAEESEIAGDAASGD